MKKSVIMIFLALLVLAGIGIDAVAADCGHKHKTGSDCCTDAVDPVCHMKIMDKAEALTYEHEGHTYYFCSEKCREAFTKDPAKYIARCCEGKIYCPVSGKEIKDKDKAVKGEYKGKTVYFCCEKCKKTFEKDPDKYMKKHLHNQKMMKESKCGEKVESGTPKEGEQE
jgi:Cu+-exporting ATPase